MGDETEQRSDDAQKAQDVEDAYREGEEKVRQLEDDPPKKLEDWPDDHAKYVTFGGREGEHSYEEGPEAKLGPSGVRHNSDGSVEIDGEKVDNPEDYKGDPIPGGPTDPNVAGQGGESETTDRPDDTTPEQG